MQKFGMVSILIVILLVASLACDSDESKGIVIKGADSVMETPLVRPELTIPETVRVGPTVMLYPATRGVRVLEEGFALGRIFGDADVILPKGYALHQRITVHRTGYRDNYLLVIGSTDLPVDRVIEVPLREEIVVGPLEEGLTQVLFTK